MDLFLPMILSYLVDTVIPARNISRIFLMGSVMILCSVLAVTFNIIANRMASAVARDAVREIRHDLYKKISYLDAAQVDRLTVSSLESRLTADTYNVHQVIGMMQRLGVRAPILLVGGLVMTFILDARLTLVLLGTLPFIAAAVFGISRRGVTLYTGLQEAVDGLTAVIRENSAGVRVIKALNRSDYEKERFDRANKEAVSWEKRAGAVMALTNPLITLFLNAGLCAVILLGAYLVFRGQSTAGKIIAFISYFTLISNALISISRIFTSLSKGSAGMKRINRVLQTEPELWLEEEEPEEERQEAEEGKDVCIRFDHVTFSYGQQPVLRDISFSLKKGQTLGIIGATGSGKSTVAALLLRMYDVQEGRILLEGRDVRKIRSRSLRSRFGIVFQNDFLFADTIRENVDFGRGLPEEAIREALRQAQAETYVKACPGAEDYRLDSKGVNLSGGQRQRLLIARALAARPPFLILDDAASALDYKTDAALRKAIRQNLQDTTTLIIAQRISAIRHADLILVLEEGRIIGRGTHEELLESCGVYREIAESQMGGGDLLD